MAFYEILHSKPYPTQQKERKSFTFHPRHLVREPGQKTLIPTQDSSIAYGSSQDHKRRMVNLISPWQAMRHECQRLYNHTWFGPNCLVLICGFFVFCFPYFLCPDVLSNTVKPEVTIKHGSRGLRPFPGRVAALCGEARPTVREKHA